MGSSFALAFIPSLLDGLLDGHVYPGQMGSEQSKPRAEETRRFIANLQFRVLVIGRANAGKTTILQRVCETTESPWVFRRGRRVRHVGPNFYSAV